MSPFLRVRAHEVAGVLFQAYSRFGGLSALDLCKQLCVRIIRPIKRPFGGALYPNGRLRSRGWTIELPEERISAAADDFLLFHECAHLFLRVGAQSLPHGSDEYWQAEEWCDAFAILMLFASRGGRVVSEEECEAFIFEPRSYTKKTANTMAANTIEAFAVRDDSDIRPDRVRELLALARRLKEGS